MPGVVKTPLWTDNPDKLRAVKQEGEGADTWVTPEEVAQVMLSCVKDKEISNTIDGSETAPKDLQKEMIQIKGGSCLEVLAGVVRDVPMFNNIGPYATGQKGASVTDGAQLYHEVAGLLQPGWGKF